MIDKAKKMKETSKDDSFLMEDLSNFEVKETIEGLRPSKRPKKTKVVESKKPVQVKKAVEESVKVKKPVEEKDEFSDIFNELK